MYLEPRLVFQIVWYLERQFHATAASVITHTCSNPHVQRSQYVTGCASTIWRFHRVPSPSMYLPEKLDKYICPRTHIACITSLYQFSRITFIQESEILLLFIVPPQNLIENLPTAHPATVPPPPPAS